MSRSTGVYRRWRPNGIEVLIPTILVYLAESYGKIERVEDGVKLISEALDLMQPSGACFNEPELHRLKGELILLSADSRTEAEFCFLEALNAARHQGAKSLELRAVVSLARLWQKQGNQDKARNLLSEIYGWFTEGFDTHDLKEAKALLHKLS